MRMQDLVFRPHYKDNAEISKVVFSNGHWLAALRHAPGQRCDSLPITGDEFLVSSSLMTHQEIVASEIELSVTLSELRITEKSPLRPCPWIDDDDTQ